MVIYLYAKHLCNRHDHALASPNAINTQAARGFLNIIWLGSVVKAGWPSSGSVEHRVYPFSRKLTGLGISMAK